ncbi:hypothetical protein, partial [Bifidobacterium pullorum]|uniref:hypothetical protein n=1 Tax=Bifidobacterium pullorum TaxID=78448 RepID=UPI003991C90E
MNRPVRGGGVRRYVEGVGRRWRHAEIQEGQILYDGINVKSIRKQDLRRSLGIVLQDVNLFTGTVMD